MTELAARPRTRRSIDAHPYVSDCERYLEIASYDPMLSGVHLKDLVDYLALPPSHWPSSDYIRENAPFTWSYTWTARGEMQLHKQSNVTKYGQSASGHDNSQVSELLFLAGYPSPGWLNTVGHKYKVDPHFYLRHMSFKPSVQVSSYSEPALPSNSGHILKLNIPTIGHIDPQVHNPSEDLQTTRQRCTALLQQSFREQTHKPTVGSSIVRRLYIHDWKRFTFEQELSVCLLQRNGYWTVVVWTDAGGEDCDPVLPLSDLPVFKSLKYDFRFCPTILQREAPDGQSNISSTMQAVSPFKTTQTFGLLHRVYGKTLKPESIQSDPFYALTEVYAFAAAAENQFLNMIDQMLAERMESLTLEPDDTKSPKSSDIQYDRNVLDAHRDRVKGIVAFLTAQDDSTWFQPFQGQVSPESTTARRSLLRDYQHLETRVEALILRCERAMEIIMNNAALAEAKFSNNQSTELANLTQITTLVTMLYVPLAYVSSFFGMNFKELANLSLWIWAAVSFGLVVLSYILLRNRLRGRSAFAGKPRLQ